VAHVQASFFFPGEDAAASHARGFQKLEGISKDILSCAQCGACVARCPVYRATGDETLTAKGKLLTIKKALEKGELELSKAMSLYFCSAAVAVMTSAKSI